MTNWIMACVEKVNYVIIINGIPSSFFLASKGLFQGCPLSPLLFILVMNSLSLHINKAVKENKCHPLKICRNISISHNLFVDDIIMFGILCRLTWLCFYEILNNFQRAIGLQINSTKSVIYHNDICQDEVDWLSALFGLEAQPISLGIKYLGFQLKANGYSKADWQGILDRYYKRISVWEYRCLSLAGRVILAQSVLNQLVVYWAHLYFLPTSIIQSMNKLTTNFIWGRQAGKTKYHLSKMSYISLPKSRGGWGLLDLRNFEKALLCKTLWRGIYEEVPWSNIIRKKYLGKKDLSFWFRKGKPLSVLQYG